MVKSEGATVIVQSSYERQAACVIRDVGSCKRRRRDKLICLPHSVIVPEGPRKNAQKVSKNKPERLILGCKKWLFVGVNAEVLAQVLAQVLLQVVAEILLRGIRKNLHKHLHNFSGGIWVSCAWLALFFLFWRGLFRRGWLWPSLSCLLGDRGRLPGRRPAHCP
jgi:hypothetical protein